MRTVTILLSRPAAALDQSFVCDLVAFSSHLLEQNSRPPARPGRPWAIIGGGRPEQDLELCRALRHDPLTCHAHITWLTREPEDRWEHARSAGANDACAEPLRPEGIARLFARIDPLYANLGHDPVLTVGRLSVDLRAFGARWAGRPFPISPDQLRLLRFFADRPQRVFVQEELAAVFDGGDTPFRAASITQRLVRLRKALRLAGVPDPFRVIRPRGFMFEPRLLERSPAPRAQETAANAAKLELHRA